MSMALIVIVFLWAVVLVLGGMTARRSRVLFKTGVKAGCMDFVRLVPRLSIGVLGSGYIAAIMPQQLIATWLGPGSGVAGTAIAVAAGALTPGGPMIGFAIGVAALKSGASPPQVVAYTTAWALIAAQRLLLWEMAMIPPRIMWVKTLAAVPIPFLAAWIAMLAGRP